MTLYKKAVEVNNHRRGMALTDGLAGPRPEKRTQEYVPRGELQDLRLVSRGAVIIRQWQRWRGLPLESRNSFCPLRVRVLDSLIEFPQFFSKIIAVQRARSMEGQGGERKKLAAQEKASFNHDRIPRRCCRSRTASRPAAPFCSILQPCG